MDAVVFNNIPYKIDIEQLIVKLRIREDSSYLETLKQLVAESLTLGNPQAMYKACYIEEKGEDYVVIDGIKFTSKVLRINLEEAYKVYPYVITVGAELDNWARQNTDMLKRFYADSIVQSVLVNVRTSFLKEIDEHFGLSHTANMNPGSLPDWPITEQKSLFRLLGDVEKSIGVTLTESSLMVPVKSVSGIHFPKEVTWENCQLCLREDCPNRKAPYDKKLHEEKYINS